MSRRPRLQRIRGEHDRLRQFYHVEPLEVVTTGGVIDEDSIRLVVATEAIERRKLRVSVDPCHRIRRLVVLGGRRLEGRTGTYALNGHCYPPTLNA